MTGSGYFKYASELRCNDVILRNYYGVPRELRIVEEPELSNGYVHLRVQNPNLAEAQDFPLPAYRINALVRVASECTHSNA